MKKLMACALPLLAALLLPSTGFAVAPAASTTAASSAAPLKIGVVDLQAVLQQSPQMTAANAKLKKQFEPQEQQILAAQKKLKADSDKLQQSGSTLAKADLAKLQAQVANDKSQLEQQFVDFRQALIAAHNKAMQTVIQQVNVAIGQIAQKNGYNIVFQKQGILYSSAGYDITPNVLASLKAAK